MGWDQHYSGRISFMRVAKPGTNREDRLACEDGEEWEKFYFMIRDKTEDCRLLDYTCDGKVDDNSSMAYSIATELNELRPSHAVELLHNMAYIIGKWGCYLVGDLFVFTEGTEHLSRILISKDKLRYYIYEHNDLYECTKEPSVQLYKCNEIDLRDLLDPNGEVPPDPDEEHRNECKLEEEIERLTAELKERKRKRAEAKRLKSKELICPLQVELFEKHVSFMNEGKKTKGYVYSEVGLPDKLLVRWKNNYHDVAYQYTTLNRDEVLEWDTV